MAETEKPEATETDIFQQQKKTIELLYDVLQRQQGTSGQPTYVTMQQPEARQAPNYVLWIAIGIGATLLLKGL